VPEKQAGPGPDSSGCLEREFLPAPGVVTKQPARGLPQEFQDRVDENRPRYGQKGRKIPLFGESPTGSVDRGPSWEPRREKDSQILLNAPAGEM